MAERQRTRVVIVGGGFGGVYAALELERHVRRDPSIEVTIVSRENFFLFTPMLHEVAASDLDVTHIVNPVRKMLRHVRFFDGDVVAIDLERCLVVVAHGADAHTHDLPYDHLVVALGSVTNFFGLPGLAERALTMKSLGDAIALRNRLIALLEEADTECAAGARDRLLTVVVAGAGFAGVETIAAVNDFVGEALRYYPNLRPRMLRMVLVHPGDVILPELTPSLGRYAERKLARRGIDVRPRTKVDAFVDDVVTLSDGTRLPCATVVWTAGTTPNPLVPTLPCAGDRGRICVNEHLEVPGWPGVWAVGDCAARWSPRTGRRVRTEHWDDALHAPEVAAATLLGEPTAYDPVPYVWSEQFGRYLQWVGWRPDDGPAVWRGDPAAGTGWSAAWLDPDGRLTGLLAVDRPRDATQARKVIDAGTVVDPGRLADPDVPVRAA